MTNINDFRLEVYEKEDWILRGFLQDEDGNAITLADLATSGTGNAGMDVYVYDEDDDPSLVVYKEAPAGVGSGVGGAWEDTIITTTTTGWSKSPPGYNLDWRMTDGEFKTGGDNGPGVNLGAIGGHRYRVELTFNLTGGTSFIVVRGYVDVKGTSSA